MRQNFHVLFGKLVGLFCLFGSLQAQEEEKEAEIVVPIRVLLISGGASHDFETQARILEAGLRERIKSPIEWRLISEGSGRSDLKIAALENSLWAENCDIVIHHHCFTRIGEGKYIDHVLSPHLAGKPAVLIHGSMQSFRMNDDRWYDFCGVTTRSHEPAKGVAVTIEESSHPLAEWLDDWISPKEELYLIDEVAPNVAVLAKSGETPVIWAHEYGSTGAKVFATSLGNDSKGMLEPSFLDAIACGLLWALERPLAEDFVEVEPDDSLSGFDFTEAAEPGLSAGYSIVQDGIASAMSANAIEGRVPQEAIDGNGKTSWEAENVGPSFWQVELPNEAGVSAIAVDWMNDSPIRYQIEGSLDGLSWKFIAEEGKSPEAAGTSVHLFPKTPIRILRVSFPETRPQERPGISEIAVYESESEIPAAYRKLSNSMNRLRTAGPDEPQRGIRLTPEWETGKSFVLPTQGGIVELQPRADGGLYVMTETEEESEIFLAHDEGESKPTARSFLAGIKPGASFTWDGEWVYLLEGVALSRLRSTSPSGQADERRRLGAIFVPDEADAAVPFAFSSLGLAMDGWIYAVINADKAIEGLDLKRRPVSLPANGVVRFKRDGTAIQPFLSSRHRIISLRPLGELSFAITSETASGESTHYRIQYGVFPGRPLESFPESPHDDEELYHSGSSIFSGDESKNRKLIATINGLIHLEPSNIGWWAATRKADGAYLVRLNKVGAERTKSLDLDRLSDLELFPLLSSSITQVQQEAVFEILRRKRDWRKEAEAMLQDRQSPSYIAALALFSQMDGNRSFGILADAGRLSHHAAAFRLLADRKEATGHPVFTEITKATNPSVTTEILAAIARSETNIDGLDSLVLSFASVDDPELSSAAREWLVQKRASEVCFAAIDDSSKEELKSAALAILSRIPKPTVAEGIVLRLEKTTDAAFRRQALETLCDLYFIDGEVWRSTPLIDAFLRASLTDRRVNTAWLLDQILGHDIPLQDPEEIVEIAVGQLPLQATTVEILTRKEALSDEALQLVEAISENDSHDHDLRTKALALALPNLDFREAFRKVSERLSRALLPETENLLLKNWKKRPDLANEADALQTKLNSSSEAEARLAQLSLSDEAMETELFPATSLEYEHGFEIFERLQCGRCHNIHGEGPGIGPDLVALLRDGSDESFITSVLIPEETIRAEYGNELIELESGVQLRGLVRSENDETIVLIDSAANAIELPKSEVRWRWRDDHSLMPSHYEGRISKEEFSALISFLRGLGSNYAASEE